MRINNAYVLLLHVCRCGIQASAWQTMHFRLAEWKQRIYS